ncbi:hypothetical protein LU293_09155 [Moraxella nasovis]|uniref:hypothetical protein n=1 Tax=Moraxella nasovis TaxID=2904121 RepID=UPI001F60F1EB|nr:hypothetical protein [Moraxella nasovis]UNU73225.1 hypothetical protein LU293_09155 [Moraxella nasovis]
MTDNSFILQELLYRGDVSFRVHNVKITNFLHGQDLPMMFLAHYDSLPDDIKNQKPLDLSLLKHMNDKVTAAMACDMLGLSHGTIKPANHLKVNGTSVIVFDDFPLALHLSFTNTAKENQTTYGSLSSLLSNLSTSILFTGNVHVLHKNPTKTLKSTDLNENTIIIAPQNDYTRLPNSHAMATTHVLNTLQQNSPKTLEFLTIAISERVFEHFNQIQQPTNT